MLHRFQLSMPICCALQAMGAMNRQMNMPALQKIMRDFEMQNERMEMTSDVMGDAIDDAFEVHPTKFQPGPQSCFSSDVGGRKASGGRTHLLPAAVDVDVLSDASDSVCGRRRPSVMA